MASGSGESGRERVGDGVPTAKLLLLLLRALSGHKKQQEVRNFCDGAKQSVAVSFMSTINSRQRKNTLSTSGLHVDHSRETTEDVYAAMMAFTRKHVGKRITERVCTVSWFVDVTTSQIHSQDNSRGT